MIITKNINSYRLTELTMVLDSFGNSTTPDDGRKKRSLLTTVTGIAAAALLLGFVFTTAAANNSSNVAYAATDTDKKESLTVKQKNIENAVGELRKPQTGTTLEKKGKPLTEILAKKKKDKLQTPVTPSTPLPSPTCGPTFPGDPTTSTCKLSGPLNIEQIEDPPYLVPFSQAVATVEKAFPDSKINSGERLTIKQKPPPARSPDTSMNKDDKNTTTITPVYIFQLAKTDGEDLYQTTVVVSGTSGQIIPLREITPLSELRDWRGGQCIWMDFDPLPGPHQSWGWYCTPLIFTPPPTD